MLARIQYKVLPNAVEDTFEISSSTLLPILTEDKKIANEKTWFIKEQQIKGLPVICRISSTKNGVTYKPLAEVEGLLVNGINGGNYLIPKENIKKKI